MTDTVSGSPSATVGRMRWPVVVLLSLGMIIAYFDRVNLTVALPEMVRDFSWNKAQQGLAMSAIFWTYTALQIPSGILVDRYGVRLPYLIGFLIWSIATASTALVTGLASLMAIRFLVGMGESVVTPASMRYIRLHFAEKERGFAVGLYMTGTKLGPALGFPVCAYLVAAHGWRPMYLLIGLVSFLWLVPWMSWVKRDDIAALPRSRQPADAAFVYYSMTWMPIYFKERHGMSIKEMGWYGGVAFAGMATVAALAGAAADWLIRRGGNPVNVRKGFTIAGFVLAATQTVAVFTHSVTMMLFFAVFSLCGLGLATAANVAGIVAPWLTGILIQQTGSFDAPIKGVGIWLVVGIGSYLLLVRPKYAPRAV